MSLIRLFIDEDSMDQRFVRALRARGVDVTTVGEIGTTSFSDEDQLILATEQQRVLIRSMLETSASYTASTWLKDELILELLFHHRNTRLTSKCDES